MAVSTARAIRSNTATVLQEKPLAQVIPFAGRRKPLEEQICSRPSAQSAQVMPFPAQDIKPRQGKSNDAEICQAIKIESAREAKAKGQFTRKSEEALNINYQLAWIVWFRYVGIMLSMGIRVSEFLKHHVEFHDQMKRGH